ncbi:unnamed protein product [Oreochromis niloticus]|nr:unnamed protein product [Mustela putorius furo]
MKTRKQRRTPNCAQRNCPEEAQEVAHLTQVQALKIPTRQRVQRVYPCLLAQRSIADAIAVGQKIVGHFKHSALAYSRLEDIQGQLNQPIEGLQQDVQTRWNSTYYILQSLTEQKRVLGVYVSEHELPDYLTAHQWALMETTVAILAPFEELTKKVSSYDALASDVIPAVTVLVRLLNRETDEDHGVKTMKATLLAAVKKLFRDVETNPLYFISTILDPRCMHTPRRVKHVFMETGSC